MSAIGCLVVGLAIGWVANDWHGTAQALDGSVAKRRFGLRTQVRTALWRNFGTKGAIVMVGDSHTDLADWKALFPAENIVNRGIGGDTTAAVLSRLETIVSVGAEKAVVTIGTNDALQGIPLGNIEGNYRMLVDKLAARGSTVIVTSTPLTTERATNTTIAKLNDDIRAYCERGHCVFVDINPVIAPNGVLTPDMTLDGIHLSGPGYAAWAAALGPHLVN